MEKLLAFLQTSLLRVVKGIQSECERAVLIKPDLTDLWPLNVFQIDRK